MADNISNTMAKNVSASAVRCSINFRQVDEIVRNEMPDEFDSHKFILKFLKMYAVSYALLLIKHNEVKGAHSQLSNFLSRNAKKLKIERVYKEDPEDEKSNSIFGNEVPNAHWRKIKK